jgi:VanZ family protein
VSGAPPVGSRLVGAQLALAWAPAAAYMALIFTISSFRVELPELPSLPMRDKLIHLVEYGVLGFFCAHATLRTWPGKPRRRMLALGAFLASAFGLSDELHQAFVPGRSAELLDFVADTIGASCGAYARGLIFWRGVPAPLPPSGEARVGPPSTHPSAGSAADDLLLGRSAAQPSAESAGDRDET